MLPQESISQANDTYWERELSRFKTHDGLPSSWLNALLSVNADFPQAADVHDYVVGHEMMRSVSQGEVQLDSVPLMGLREDQLKALVSAGNQYHADNGISQITEVSILIAWRRMSHNLSRLGKMIQKWEEPEKINIVLELFDVNTEAINLPESQKARVDHVIFAVTNPSEVCAVPALTPLFRNANEAVKDKVTEIELDRKIQVPDGIVRWFTVV